MSKLKSITFKSVQAVMILTVSIVLLYLYEKSQSVSDYIVYYGNVTTQNEYHFPERLSSYTFGASDGPVEMDFVNKLVCKPIGTDYTPLVLAHVTNILIHLNLSTSCHNRSLQHP